EQVLLVAAVLSSEEEAKRQGFQEITIPELKTEMAASSFPETIEKRRKSALRLTSFRQARIQGDVHLDQKSILVLQTPFDHGSRCLRESETTRRFALTHSRFWASGEAKFSSLESCSPKALRAARACARTRRRSRNASNKTSNVSHPQTNQKKRNRQGCSWGFN